MLRSTGGTPVRRHPIWDRWQNNGDRAGDHQLGSVGPQEYRNCGTFAHRVSRRVLQFHEPCQLATDWWRAGLRKLGTRRDSKYHGPPDHPVRLEIAVLM